MAALRVTGSAESGRPVSLQSARRHLVLTPERQEEERLRRSALDYYSGRTSTPAEARPDDLSFRAAARRRQVQYGVPFRGEEHVIRAGPELDRRAGAVVFTCVLAVLPAEDGADWGIDPRPARMPYDHAWILWEDPVTVRTGGATGGQATRYTVRRPASYGIQRDASRTSVSRRSARSIQIRLHPDTAVSGWDRISARE